MFAHGLEENFRLLRAKHRGICEILNEVMGTELWSSETAGSARNSGAISLTLVDSDFTSPNHFGTHLLNGGTIHMHLSLATSEESYLKMWRMFCFYFLK